MNPEQEKYEVFLKIWETFLTIKDTLVRAGIDDSRFVKKETLEKRLHEFHVNKLRDSLSYIEGFISLYVGPWQKLRKENNEVYWANAKLFKWGDEYTEIRELNIKSKAIRENWFKSRNILVREKRVKNVEEQTQQ